MKSLIKFLPVLAAAYLSTSLSAHAVLINVDFGGSVPTPAQTGAGAIGSGADVWNGVFNSSSSLPISASSIPLVNSANVPTTVSLSYNVLFGYTAPAVDSPFDGTPYESLMRSFFGAQGTTPGTISVTGLAAGQYALYLYSAADNGGAGQQQRTTDFTANGITGSAGPNNGASTLTAGQNYVKLNITVLGDGLLNISFINPDGVNTPGAEGDINGFQLQSIPEPSAAALLGAGLVTMVLIRRRQKNQALS